MNYQLTEEQTIYLLSFITALYFLLSFKYYKNWGKLNLLIFILYTSYFYYGLLFKSTEGIALGWLAFIYIVTGLHLIYIAIYTVAAFIYKKVMNKK